MIVDVLKAFAIGICASAPLGPAAILVLQKSLSYGHRAGFYTGLGATTIDTTYATLSIFALAWTQDFINTYEYTIYLIGGLIVALLGQRWHSRTLSGSSKTEIRQGAPR